MSDEGTPGEPRLNPAAIVAALNRHQVRYVIIGAFAAIAQQAPISATRDIDFTPAASQDNLAKLSRALTDLGAKIRTEAVPEGLPFSRDATSLAAAERTCAELHCASLASLVAICAALICATST